MTDGEVRFADLLTTAVAVAGYLGSDEVRPRHLRAALAVLTGERTLEALGRPVSPLLRRSPTGPPVAPAVRAFVQQWFALLGGDVNAQLSPERCAELSAALEALNDDADAD
ncbi:MAG: hypothetical protein IT304_00785 [Dehalococcoidia bacterium]|nr:hypothetical protein [Dehalococcoidia bacterium]